jgi:hypothetical protein
MDCHQTECDVFKLTLCQNIYTPHKNRIETLLGGILYERLNLVQENLIGSRERGVGYSRSVCEAVKPCAFPRSVSRGTFVQGCALSIGVWGGLLPIGDVDVHTRASGFRQD